MNPERMSSIHKVAGGTPEQQDKIIHDLEEEFLQKKIYTDEEREKTSEENEIIEAVIVKLNVFLAEYGARPLDLKTTHIHILDKTKMSEEALKYLEKRFPTSGGYYQNDRQDVMVLGWNIVTPLDLARVIVHELIHFLSYNSVILSKKERVGSVPYRIGLAVQPSNTEIPQTGMKYFNEINEAVTEELTMRFYNYLKEIPLLAEEYAKVIDTREKYSFPDLAAMRVDTVEYEHGKGFEAKLVQHAYPELRKKFNHLLKEIYEKGNKGFTSEEDVFKIFARAAMTGEVKELASIIDSTLGSGTFKKIAQSLTGYVKDE